MTQMLAVPLVAVTALHMIRYNGKRHVPGTENQTFEVDADTADRLVKSGAAVYAPVITEAQAFADASTAVEPQLAVALAVADQPKPDQAAAEQVAADQPKADQAVAEQAAADQLKAGQAAADTSAPAKPAKKR